MTRANRIKLLCCALLLWGTAQAQKLEFSLHKHQSGKPGPTLLVIGGIQGDEPGGFNAASLLVTDYRITAGEVWVVPNLNFESIIQRSRGVYGDMNRKFLNLQEADPEYAQIQKIKSIILDPQVTMILNLHDGGGFFTPTYLSQLANPDRWGQSVIIDQDKVEGITHGELDNIAGRVIKAANGRIGMPAHYYHIKNTQTRLGNEEMEKTLSYFAVRHGKSAFGIEASKEFLTHERSFFHLNMVEAFMQDIGVGFERDFSLTQHGVKRRIEGNIRLAMYDNRILFDMVNARSILNYVPLKKDAPLDFTPSNPLIALLRNQNNIHVRYGNRHVTYLRPQYLEYDDSLNTIRMVIDDEEKEVRLGSEVVVAATFKVLPMPDYRVNVIGFKRAGVEDESDITIDRQMILKNFSIDKQGKMYRLEIYRADKFCGMVLVRFESRPVAKARQGTPVGAVPHPASNDT